MASQENFQRNDAYVTRIPSPPRLYFPPHNLNSSLNFLHNLDKVPPEILQAYDWTPFTRPFDTLDWTYEQRRTAQMILPYLYLGPMSIARDPDFLSSQKITMILAVLDASSQSPKMGSGLRQAAESGINVQIVGVQSRDSLIRVFEQATAMINRHIELRSMASSTSNGQAKIVVVCESGNERSAVIVIAHILNNFQCTLIEAVHVVHQRRFCAVIDDTARTQLLTYKGLLDARRMVSNAPISNETTMKRTLDDITPAEPDDQLQDGTRDFNPFTNLN